MWNSRSFIVLTGVKISYLGNISEESLIPNAVKSVHRGSFYATIKLLFGKVVRTEKVFLNYTMGCSSELFL